MTAADLYAVFMRATRTAEPLPFEELPTVAPRRMARGRGACEAGGSQ